MGNKFNLFMSGFFAIGIYILVILSFLFYIKDVKIEKYTTASTETILELDLIISESTKVKKKNKVQLKANKLKKDNNVVKQSKSLSAKKVTSMKSLFANVKTTATKVKTKTVNNKKNTSVSSRFKSKFEKEKTSKNIKIDKMLDVGDSIVKKKISVSKSNTKLNEYYSKLNLIILQRWYSYPLFNNNNYFVKAIIKIDLLGNMSYNILQFSGNVNVDDAIKKFLQNESLKKYPVKKNGENKDIVINFKPEQK
jgi:hypothetical protein